MQKNINGKFLRCGYTTGSCATAAAKAAAIKLMTGVLPNEVSIFAPKGFSLTIGINPDGSVTKDSGDDPDITNGVKVFAKVNKTEGGITIDGGIGIGRVTKPGLDQPVGAAAINSVPRKMIEAELENVAKEYNYTGGFAVIIFVPGGDKLAQKTFNPKMGIEGGISIIGTTGIVEPMSHVAIADTVKLTLNQLRLGGTDKVILVPGNYGEAFARDKLALNMTFCVLCSNCIGAAIDAAAELEFKQILLVSHIGKLVKLGIGITNTHSDFGDGRIETLLACALTAGADIPLLKGISECVTADAALMLIDSAGLLEQTMSILRERILDTLTRRVPNGIEIGFVCFTNTELGILCKGGLDCGAFRGSGAGRG